MGLELVKITGEMQLEHQKPVGPSNQENRTTFWAVPLFLGIFQLGQSFSPNPEFLEFLTKWKVPQVNGDSTRTKKLKLHYKVSAKYGALQTSTVCKPHSTIHSAGIFFFTSSWPSLIFFFSHPLPPNHVSNGPSLNYVQLSCDVFIFENEKLLF